MQDMQKWALIVPKIKIIVHAPLAQIKVYPLRKINNNISVKLKNITLM